MHSYSYWMETLDTLAAKCSFLSRDTAMSRRDQTWIQLNAKVYQAWDVLNLTHMTTPI